MKSRSRKTKQKRNKNIRLRRVSPKRTKTKKRRAGAGNLTALRRPIPENRRQTLVHQKALAVLARMRRQKLSLSKAARLEHIKQNTFLRYVGSAGYRTGPRKPWRVPKCYR